MHYKDFILKNKEILSKINSKNEKINLIKEELQKNILYSIYSRNIDIYFLGGTNLRICYGLDRFSEDLDFELCGPESNYDIMSVINPIKNDFINTRGYKVDINIGRESSVRRANIKFTNILYDLGISSLRDEKISIKIEIDTTPPSGSEYSSYIINSSFGVCKIKNQNINSTFAGKIGALLLRDYSKGRDYYDIYWYLNNFSNEQFNLKYLSNIITQYNYINDKNLFIPQNNKEVLNMILEKIENTDYNQVKKDLIRFMSWDKTQLNTFFENYIETIYILIKKYNDNLSKDKDIKRFRL